MAKTGQPLTNKELTIVYALYMLENHNEDTTNRVGRFYKGRSITEVTGVRWTSHTRSILEKLCANRWVEREVIGNAFCYKLTGQARNYVFYNLHMAHKYSVDFPLPIGVENE